jgi:hypothetical protein
MSSRIWHLDIEQPDAPHCPMERGSLSVIDCRISPYWLSGGIDAAHPSRNFDLALTVSRQPYTISTFWGSVTWGKSPDVHEFSMMFSNIYRS